MKKIISIFLCVIMLFSLVGCELDDIANMGNTNNTTNKNNATEESVLLYEEKDFKIMYYGIDKTDIFF